MPLTDPTVLFYSQYATHLAQKYDQTADGILPIVEKFARSKDLHILDSGEARESVGKCGLSL